MRRQGGDLIRLATVAVTVTVALSALAAAPIARGASAPAPEVPSSPRTITILGVGDAMIHRQIIDQAAADATGGRRFDFRPQYAGIRELVSAADIAICHVEFPVGTYSDTYTAYPSIAFSPPHWLAAASWAGFDSCSTASNHTLDKGMYGVTTTLDMLDQAGLRHAGSARTPEEAAQTTILEVDGVKVAHLSYTFSFNGIPQPNDYCCNLIDTTEIIDRARAARSDGARIIVASLHFGEEDSVAVTSYQRSVVSALAKSRAVDLVLGHHAHVVQQVEKVNGMWVAFGHGNLYSAMERGNPRRGDGLITQFTFTEQRTGGFRVTAAEGFAVLNTVYPFRLRLVGRATDWSARAAYDRVRAQVFGGNGYEKGFRLRRR